MIALRLTKGNLEDLQKESVLRSFNVPQPIIVSLEDTKHKIYEIHEGKFVDYITKCECCENHDYTKIVLLLEHICTDLEGNNINNILKQSIDFVDTDLFNKWIKFLK